MDSYTAMERHLYVSDPAAETRDLLVDPGTQLARLRKLGLTAKAKHLEAQLKLNGRCLPLNDSDLALVNVHFPVFIGSGQFAGEVPEDVLDWIEEITDLDVFSSIGYLVAPEHGDTFVIGTAGPFAETDKPVQYAIAQWGPEIHTIDKLRVSRQQAIAPIQLQKVEATTGSDIPGWAILVPQVVTVSSAPIPYLLHGARVGFVILGIALVITIVGGLAKRSSQTQALAAAALWIAMIASLITSAGDVIVYLMMSL